MSFDFTSLLDPKLREPVPWNLGDYLEHFSATSLALLGGCPEQFRYRYILKKPETPGEARITGSAVHYAVERNMRQKIASGEDLPLAELLDWHADEGFEHILEREQEKTGLDVMWDRDSSEQNARTRSALMIAEDHKLVAPRIQPLAVEEWFEADMGLPVPIVGRLDIVRRKSAIDKKTGKAARRKPKGEWMYQAACYQEVTRKPVEFHHIAVTMAKHSITVTTPLESEAMLVSLPFRQHEQVRHTLQVLVQLACFYMDTFGPDEPWPTFGRFDEWRCDWCSFRDVCPAWTEAL